MKEKLNQLLTENPKITQKEIASSLNISTPTVKKYLDLYGLSTDYMKKTKRYKEISSSLSKEDLEEDYYKNNLSQREIAEKYSLTTKVVRKLFKDFKIPAKDNSERKQIYAINQNYFDELDTCQKCYFLGFLLADGYTTRGGATGITISAKDISLLEAFKKELSSEHPIKIKEVNGFKYATFIFTNKRIYNNLLKYGVVPNKTEVVDIGKVAEQIEDPAKVKCLLLGYFDGDGGFTKWHHPNGTTIQYGLGITGTRETCEYYQRFFSGVKSRIYKRHDNNTNNYTLQISSKGPVFSAMSGIYEVAEKNLSYFLKRKHDIFKETKPV